MSQVQAVLSHNGIIKSDKNGLFSHETFDPSVKIDLL